ncbi:MAG TPA: hypothetical protein VGG85_09155 [Terracidiphilus sp.]
MLSGVEYFPNGRRESQGKILASQELPHLKKSEDERMTLPAVAPSASTKSMSVDRKLAGKLMGHLYIAAKSLLEGHVSSMDEVRHEIRAIMHGHAETLPEGADEETEEGSSLQAWRKLVMRLIVGLRKFPDDSNCLPDRFKRDLARCIKKGKKVSQGGGAVAQEAQKQICRANLLYRQLSGASYV